MQSCCRGSGPVQNVEWQWHFSRHPMMCPWHPHQSSHFAPGDGPTVSRIDAWSQSQTAQPCQLDPAQQDLGDPKPTTSRCQWDSSPPLCFGCTALCVRVAHERWVWSCGHSRDASASGSLLPSIRAMTTGWDQHQYGITVPNYSYFSGDYIFHGGNYQDLGNARKNQLEKQESFCWHSHNHDFNVWEVFFPSLTQKDSWCKKGRDLAQTGPFWICIELLFLREAGLPPNSYARGWMS